MEYSYGDRLQPLGFAATKVSSPLQARFRDAARTADYVAGDDPTTVSSIYDAFSASVNSHNAFVRSSWSYKPRTDAYAILEGRSVFEQMIPDSTLSSPIYWDYTAADSCPVKTFSAQSVDDACTTPAFNVTSGDGIVFGPTDLAIGTATMFLEYKPGVSLREIMQITTKQQQPPAVAGFYRIHFDNVFVPLYQNT